jgi:hypothetical protein
MKNSADDFEVLNEEAYTELNEDFGKANFQ